MSKIYAYTITRANTKERARLLLETLTAGRDTAGVPFHWHIHVNGKGSIGENIVESAYKTQIIDSYEVSEVNEGQHPPTNTAIAKAIAENCDYILRIDDDVEWISKRWLAKLVEASEKLGQNMVLSPVVKGLRWQPPQSNTVEIEQIPIKFIEGPIGGVCRLTPIKLLKDKPYVSDVRLPMGGGDAAGVGSWAMLKEPIAFLAYCQHIKIRHAKSTDGQVAEDAGHFENHRLYQHMPYIPTVKNEPRPC